MSKQLLFSLNKKDFEIQFFRAGGHGGENVNKRSSACRIIHPKSGAVAVCRSYREQIKNKEGAFKKLTRSKRFQTWLKIEAAMLCSKQKSPEEIVDDLMNLRSIKFEIKENEKWVEVSPETLDKNPNNC